MLCAAMLCAQRSAKESTMNDVTVKRIDEIPAYEGPHALPGIQFRFAAKALGVSAWGMNIGVVAPGGTNWPVHDHLADGQEEV
jgi:uncharacterized cupin superfamily protein